MQPNRSLATFVLAAMVFAASAQGAEIGGSVDAVTGDTFTAMVSSDLLPRPGDPVEVYFVFPGEGDVRVATGLVARIDGDRITAHVDRRVGTLNAGQSVRIRSQTPTRKGVPVPREPQTESGPAGDRSSGVALGKLRNYGGFIYGDKRKVVANLTLSIDQATYTVETVIIDGRTFDRSSGLQAAAAGKPPVIRGFPSLGCVAEAGEDKDIQATLEFDPNAKPTDSAKELYGTIRVETGRSFAFSVQSGFESQVSPRGATTGATVGPGSSALPLEGLPFDSSDKVRKAMAEDEQLLKKNRKQDRRP